MLTVILNHKVHDYNAWLPIFESHANVRRGFGFSGTQVLRATNDPNDVTVIFRCRDQQTLARFLQDSELNETMTKAGVIGIPAIHTYQITGDYPN